MSKIVILDSVLYTPHIVNDSLARLAVANPVIAKWAENLDPLLLVREIATKTLESIKSQGVKISSTVEDYYGKSFSSFDGEEFLAVLKTDKLSRGMALIMTKDGSIKFAADREVGSSKEMNHLQKMFQRAFFQECAKMLLEIIGYKITVTTSQVNDPETGETMPRVFIQADKEEMV